MSDWAFPEELRPDPAALAYDLEAALAAVVELRAEVPDDAFTARILGTERAGSGVVISEDGLVLTIGYLITEASRVWLSTAAGRASEAYALAWDQPTGFGLVRALAPLGVGSVRRASAAACPIGGEVVVAAAGGRRHALSARVFARREFAGYWEYVLDEALFTVPAHPQWGGAAVFDSSGRLVAIGSLLVEEKTEGETVHGNMHVPVELLEPILDDLVRLGRARCPPRPWLGIYAAEVAGQLVVSGLAPGGPAERAGLRTGDALVAVGGVPVQGLANFFRRVWALGAAGVTVPLGIVRGRARTEVQVQSADREAYLRRPALH